MQLRLSLVLAALMMLPASGAQETGSLPHDLAASRISFQGDVDIAGRLLALHVFRYDSGSASATLDGTGTAWAEYADYLAVTGVGVETGNGTDDLMQGPLLFTMGEAKQGYRVFVAPIPDHPPPDIRIKAGGVDLLASNLTHTTAPDLTGVSPPQQVNVSAAVRASQVSDASTVTVSGAFRAVMWSIDGHLSNETAGLDIASGALQEPVAPLPGSGAVASETRFQMVFFHVTNGTLALDLPAQNIQEIFTEQMGISGKAVVSAFGSNGQIIQRTESADIDVAVRNDGRQVALQRSVEPPVAASEDDATTAPWSPLAPESRSASWTPWLVGPVVLGGLAVAARPVVGRRRFRRLQSLFEAEQHREVARRYRGLARFSKHRWPAATMGIASLLHLDRPDAAMSALARAERYPEASEAGLDYLTALIAAKIGDDEAANLLLARATEELGLAGESMPESGVHPAGASTVPRSRDALEGYT